MFPSLPSPASDRVRRTKTNIVRTRTGCQNCRKRRRKCGEERPECQGCVRRGMKCSGYERAIAFKDVSSLAAESSRKFEAARWAALRAEDERSRKRRRSEDTTPESRVETLSSGSDDEADGEGSSSSSRDPAAPKVPSPRQYRRAPPAVSRQQSASFDLSDTNLTPIDPALYNSTSPDFDTPDSFDMDTPQSQPLPEDPPCNHTSSALVTTTSLPPTQDLIHPSLPPAQEASLISHFQTHVLSNIPVPMSFGASYMANTCFRNAILALSSVSQSYLEIRTRLWQPVPTTQLRRSAVGREHYLAAVSELYRRLTAVDLAADAEAREQHAAAALMLAYYEIETGSPFGSLRHARGLDALLSRLEINPSPMSGVMGRIWKAWRLLRYDVRYISIPYRASAVQTDAHEGYASLDPQLGIRDVYTLAFQLVGRVCIEAGFEAAEGWSRSRQAAVWIRDVGGRMADRRNVERGDYHDDELTGEEVLRRCEGFARALDVWHAQLGVEDRPMVKVECGSPFVTGRTAFEPIVVMGFRGGDRKAFEYEMYVTARCLVSYMVSVYDGRRGSAAETAAWAKLLMGIVCGMEHKQMMFSYLSTVSNVFLAAMVCEGMEVLNMVLDGVFPFVLGQGIPQSELADWLYCKRALEVCRRERVRGKTVRYAFLTLDEDYEKGHFDTECSLLAFGDYNGKGHFRDVYSIADT